MFLFFCFSLIWNLYVWAVWDLFHSLPPPDCCSYNWALLLSCIINIVNFISVCSVWWELLYKHHFGYLKNVLAMKKIIGLAETGKLFTYFIPPPSAQVIYCELHFPPYFKHAFQSPAISSTSCLKVVNLIKFNHNTHHPFVFSIINWSINLEKYHIKLFPKLIFDIAISWSLTVLYPSAVSLTTKVVLFLLCFYVLSSKQYVLYQSLSWLKIPTNVNVLSVHFMFHTLQFCHGHSSYSMFPL